MRVTHVIKATGLAGAEAHLLALLPALAGLGVDGRLVVLVAPGREPEAFLSAARAARLAVERLPIYADFDPTLAFRLAARLRRWPPDILHTHLIHADLHGAAARPLAGVGAAVLTRHNDDRFRRLPGVRALNRLALARADRVIAISRALGDFAVQTEGAHPAKVRTIHYGLAPEAYLAEAQAGSLRREMGWGATTPVALFVGRLTGQKGVETLLAAWAGVAKECPEAHLVIAGDGALRPRLEQQASTLASNSNPNPVHFLGWRPDVPALMLDADVLVAPSLWEGFGMVTLEAMAASKPVIASRVSALPEIVADGVTGRLVPPADPARLAGAIIGALAGPARARQMGQAGRARLEAEFTVEKMAWRHVEVYGECLRPH